MKNPIDVIRNKRLTGFSTPFGGISWEDKDVNLKGKKDIQIDLSLSTRVRVLKKFKKQL